MAGDQDEIHECGDCKGKVQYGVRGIEGLQCSLCRRWFHVKKEKCQKIKDNIYNALISDEGSKMLYWNCTHCAIVGKPLIDRLSDLIKAVTETETKLEEEKTQRKTLEKQVNNNEVKLKEEEIRRISLEDRMIDMETRMNTNEEKVLKITDRDKPDDQIKTYTEATVNKLWLEKEFPPLEDARIKKAIEDQTEDIRQGLRRSTAATKEKQEVEIAEMKRRKSREKNLVFYNVLEEECTSVGDLMKKDFNKIKQLYEDKVQIKEDDITAITRLGAKKEDSIRPIRIIFKEESKKTDVLRNNRGLIIEDDNLEICKCETKTKHIHVHVSTDRTEIQREIDRKLLLELKRRKKAGETGLVIRNEKIVPFREMTRPSWASVWTA